MITLPDLRREIHVAPSYVHLGGLVEPDMKLVQEARRRLGIAKTAIEAGKSLHALWERHDPAWPQGVAISDVHHLNLL